MIPLPSNPKIKERISDNEAIFEVESLYPGYGVTVGNSLRRVLLSSLEGTAVTRVKIEGVQHEFSTIEGVKEDVINIILNLKQLNFKLFSEEAQKATLSVKGEKEVVAGDFDFPTQVEVVNPDSPVATITQEGVELEMEITIEKGVGFVSSEERKEGKEEVGQITVDAIFTPVKSANFDVENMRVGERTDFDRLTVEVETDGSVAPEKAITRACDILIKHFEIVRDSLVDKKSEKIEEAGEEKKEKDSGIDSEISLDELDLSSRIKNILTDEKFTLKKLKEMSKDDLLEIDGIGDKSADKILEAIK